jgi:catechol 2,3-dioxygenase-like lactoylglutathione lyase family enzyme
MSRDIPVVARAARYVAVVSTRVAPIFPVADLVAALSYYRGLGFGVRHWHSGGYGIVTFDGAEIHLGVESDLDTRTDRRASAYLFVDDADALAATWLAAGGDVRLPEDTEWGKHEGVLIDPDGNVIRFGSPMTADQEIRSR